MIPHILSCLIIYAFLGADGPCEYKKDAGSHGVETLLLEWTDKERDRKIPVKIYLPKDCDSTCPLILYSHGLGGSRNGYEYLGRHWASYGYISCHLQHPGSDDTVWKGQGNPLKAMKKAAANWQNAMQRPKDVVFALDKLSEMNKGEGPLEGKLDMDRVGMAGHSFGAHTTMLMAGQKIPLMLKSSLEFYDPRIKAAIPMSSPVPKNKKKFKEVYGSVKIPCFHMTGTLDESIIADTKAEERRIPFDQITGIEQYLVTFKDGDHMIFSGRGRLMEKKSDALFQELIRMGSMAFWDAYLLEDKKALEWLDGKGFEGVLGENGVFEKKHKKIPAQNIEGDGIQKQQL